MSSSYITISYYIILHLITCFFILSLLLIRSPFNSILFYFIEFDLLYCSVLYLISMNDLCLSVRPSVCLSVRLSVCMNKFMFSLLFSFSYLFSLFSFLFTYFFLFSFFPLFFLFSFLFLFSLPFLYSLFS